MKKTYSVLATFAALALLSACANTQSSDADTNAANAPPALQESASAVSASDANVFQGE